MNFFIAVYFSSIYFIPSIYGKYEKPLPKEQPGCYHCAHTMIFYENHAYYVKDAPSKNWICHEPYPKLLKYCFTMYKMFTTSINVQVDEYKVMRDEDTVEKECKKRRMTFWQPEDFSSESDDFSSESEESKRRTNVTLDVRMFYCPITKMNLTFFRKDKPSEILDFYIAEGRNEGTLAVLHNSTVCDNICVTHMYRPARDFIREYF